jgi:small-conductance mechanosensitive channel
MRMHRCGWAAALWLALAFGAGAALAQAPASSPVLPDADFDSARVDVDGIELFRIRGVTSYPAERRAQEIAARIERLAADPSVAPETLALAESPLGIEIRAGRVRIVTVTDADAELEGLGRDRLAVLVQQRIQEAMRAYREGRSHAKLVAGVLRTVAALAVCVVALLLLRWISRRTAAGVERRFRRRVQKLAIGSFEFVRADRLWSYLRAVLRGLRLFVGLTIAFFFLEYSLRQFPWTRGTAAQLDDWVIGPVRVIGKGLLGFVPNLIFLVILYFFTRWALRLLRLFFDGVGSGEVVLEGFYPEWAAPTFKLVRLAVVVFAVVVAYPYIPGSGSDAFKGISIFLGLVFSLGSTSSISNIIAGYTMTYRRLFREGDRVRIGDVFGTVTKIRLQVTHICTPKNEEAVLPNSSILNAEVINYSTMAKSEGLILHTAVGIGYETPWRQVEAMLLLAAERTPGLAAGRQPFVLQTALGDFAVTYELNVHSDDPDRMLFQYADLHRQILDVFNEYGIQIMTPAYRNDPEQPKIVPRGEWFNAPAAPATPEQGRPGAS